MQRRDFLTALLVGTGAMSGAGLAAARAMTVETARPEPEAVLKLSSQEWLVPGRDLRERVLKLEGWGAAGIELGGGGLPGRVQEVKDALKGTSIEVSAICAGYEGVLISPDPAVRQQAVQSMKEILTAAGCSMPRRLRHPH